MSVLARDFNKMTIPTGSGGDLAGQKLVDKNLKLFSGTVTDQASVDKVFEGKDITGVIIGWIAMLQNINHHISCLQR